MLRVFYILRATVTHYANQSTQSKTMNAEFKTALCQSLPPLERTILNSSSTLKKVAMGVRKSTELLPVELSVMIAVQAVMSACNDMYAKILEIVILLFIREMAGLKPHPLANGATLNFTRVPSVKATVLDIEVNPLDILHFNMHRVQDDDLIRQDVPFIDFVPDGWLREAALEIVSSPKWRAVAAFIHFEDVDEAIFGSKVFISGEQIDICIAECVPQVYALLLTCTHDDDDGLEYIPTRDTVGYHMVGELRNNFSSMVGESDTHIRRYFSDEESDDETFLNLGG